MIVIRRRRAKRADRRVWDGLNTDTGQWFGWEFGRRPWAEQKAAGFRSGRTTTPVGQHG